MVTEVLLYKTKGGELFPSETQALRRELEEETLSGLNNFFETMTFDTDIDIDSEVPLYILRNRKSLLDILSKEVV